MILEFIGHSSIFLKLNNGKTILMDPWYHGTVFNDGWALVSKPKPANEDEIDYLWISHEHPDHMHFPTLKEFCQESKDKIQVLHQKHSSPRVKNAITKMLKFKHFSELPLYRWTKIESGIEVFCGSVGVMDSFFAVKADGKTVVNLNDCVLNKSQLKYVKSKLGKIDVLCTQFSFANWVGNDHDQMKAANRKKEQFKMQNEILSPKVIIPFASFVYFCNEENKRMNDWINSPTDISNLGLNNVMFMYPGNEYNLDNEIDSNLSKSAILNYEADYKKVSINPVPAAVVLETLLENAKKRLSSFTAEKSIAKDFKDLVIFVTDHNKYLRLSFSKNEVSLEEENNNPNLEMCSQVANYMLEHPWGSASVQISGMYLDHTFDELGAHPFFKHQNRLSTEFISFKTMKSFLSSMLFLWSKKWEIFYRFVKI